MGPPLPLPQKSLKRDASHLSSPVAPESSQTKRLRVAFDDKVDIRIMDDWTAKPLDLVKDEVRSAIDGHLRAGGDKDDSAYEQLRMVFISAQSSRSQDDGAVSSSSDAPNTALLKKYLVALSGRVSDLKACGKLVHAVIDVNWLGRDDAFVALFIRFLGTLGSAVPGFLRTVLDLIVGHFVDLPASLGRIPNEMFVSRQQMTGRLHNALRYLLRLIPSANSGLAESLRSQFPNHRTATRQGYVAYVKNALKVIEYAPELKAEIQTLVTERLVKLDVEVQEELDDLEDHVDERTVLGLSALSDEKDLDDDDDSDAESDTSSELSVTPEEQQLQALRDTVTKLDSVLDLLFAHYTPIFASGKIYEVNDAFEHLISQFSTFVLPTYRSRHTQFLIFHFAQVSQAYAERFATSLLRIATRPNTSNGALSAAAYLASFIARGARISKSLIRGIFSTLSSHLEKLRRSYEPVCDGPNLSRYAPFYAVAQAMLYIYCFRWRDFILTPDDADVDDYDIFEEGEPEWLPNIKECFTQAIYSKLNPLKVCAPAIVHQFGAIANHLRFMYVIPLLETNKRLRLSSFRSAAAPVARDMMGAARRDNTLSHQSGEAHHQLDAFFPFDPYQLPKSKKWLEGDYMVWKGVPGMQDDDDDDDDDEDDSSDEEDDEDDIGDIGDDPEYQSE